MASNTTVPVITPLAHPEGSKLDFGATVSGVDIENLTDRDFAILRTALFTHQVLVIKSQSHVSPRAQYELTQRFDPLAAPLYGHGNTDSGSVGSKSILHPDLKTIPHQPQVQVIGNGFVPTYEGLSNIQLRHPHHRTFHSTSIPASHDLTHTRFYRWHIDAALYGGVARAPPVVTTLLAVKVPQGRRQTCVYDDGTGDELDVPLGTTAFVSGYKMYDILSETQKAFARSTRVEYAPHPYVWMSSAKSRSTGLGLVSEGKEMPMEELPEIEEDRIQILPMCWRNPVTGKLALQVHPSAVRRLHLEDGTVVEDLKEVREIVYGLQRPGIAPGLVYAHDWEEGDLVIFHNRGTLHSVVGAFAESEVRLFRQCNIAGSEFPMGPEEEEKEEELVHAEQEEGVVEVTKQESLPELRMGAVEVGVAA
ncbi:Clavaminate synthase-like protein [Neurospora crassa]|uniref:Alpha-ketoglutarate-dependent xanthine dioxygenase xan-1 n=1 Tax=Neurospora crassa (strain ATCC 24698 / 74-OR23-1A / CBS 708.71 / DSM 1257 / FGSC 987) TaxID=367110 RepID=XANA_NEUCR|nr:alpha-ketoglutarate dependent xanthine dioxygenase [Neurospora crassa OR74A]Q7SEI7.1 RecName: Full=Alpha-ketoglutarate-dependent xanthine dioxygenase xan-1 [Neurospora crassa OR74A]EAA35204.1 alpha-ketoglutarate dependent xanthine dioxygenase [Neurospora crassa OR74A]KHE81447.1 Clavaminate synthase-like protein [Neurospora crassa]|eukprot:XP_964440.1 alpha-ketoglutarate dependent xanthine dioxygenase [Neurospora crassa OR74A]